DVDVLARLQAPDGGQGVPVVRHRDHDPVDVLVVEHATQVLHVTGLEGGDVGKLGIVGAAGEQVRVDVAQRLDLDVGQRREPALERVALAADADAGQHHAVVGAQDAAGGGGGAPALRAGRGGAAQRHPGHRQGGARDELAPGDVVRVVAHESLL